jgi:hypothetical protein
MTAVLASHDFFPKEDASGKKGQLTSLEVPRTLGDEKKRTGIEAELEARSKRYS